jgi:ethanolamine ammonia-lyase small subunit
MTPAHASVPESWSRLRRFTNARIALGRAGGSLPTAALLDFRLSHARARDALLRTLDETALADALAKASGLPVELCSSAAPDLGVFLGRPDLGRRLCAGSAARLIDLRREPPPELALVVSEGLSTLAVENHAAAVLAELVPGLREDGWTLAPLCLVRRGRVAVQDSVGAALGTTHALILLGERPGLGTPDSLGAYLVRDPRPGNTDAQRNCVSNIHAAGLRPPEAAAKLRWLLNESRRRRLSGVDLKDESDRVLISAGDSGKNNP